MKVDCVDPSRRCAASHVRRAQRTDFWECLQHEQSQADNIILQLCPPSPTAILTLKEALDSASWIIDMLYVIGLGLSDEKDITVKGLEVCSSIFGSSLEVYCLTIRPRDRTFCDIRQ